MNAARKGGKQTNNKQMVHYNNEENKQTKVGKQKNLIEN